MGREEEKESFRDRGAGAGEDFFMGGESGEGQRVNDGTGPEDRFRDRADGITQGIMNLRSPPAYPTGGSTVTYVNYPPGYNDNWMNDIIADSDSWGTQEEEKEEEREDEQEDEEVEQLPPLAVLADVAGMEEAIGGPRPPPRPRSRARAGYLE